MTIWLLAGLSLIESATEYPGKPSDNISFGRPTGSAATVLIICNFQDFFF